MWTKTQEFRISAAMTLTFRCRCLEDRLKQVGKARRNQRHWQSEIVARAVGKLKLNLVEAVRTKADATGVSLGVLASHL